MRPVKLQVTFSCSTGEGVVEHRQGPSVRARGDRRRCDGPLAGCVRQLVLVPEVGVDGRDGVEGLLEELDLRVAPRVGQVVLPVQRQRPGGYPISMEQKSVRSTPGSRRTSSKQGVGPGVLGALLPHAQGRRGEPGDALSGVVVVPDELALAVRLARDVADVLGVLADGELPRVALVVAEDGVVVVRQVSESPSVLIGRVVSSAMTVW